MCHLYRNSLDKENIKEQVTKYRTKIEKGGFDEYLIGKLTALNIVYYDKFGEPLSKGL